MDHQRVKQWQISTENAGRGGKQIYNGRTAAEWRVVQETEKENRWYVYLMVVGIT